MPNIIQYYRGDLPETHKKASLSIQEKKPEGYGYIFETKLPSHILETSHVEADSDLFRLDWLLKNPFDIWMDLDVTVDKWFPFVDNGKPYFCHDWGYHNTWIIAPIGNVDVLLELQNIVIPKGIVPSNPLCRLIDGHKDEIDLIPNGFFRHKQFNLNQKEEVSNGK